MKKISVKIGAIIIAILMFCVNVHASFISDSPVYTGVQSEVSMEWGERGSIVNNFLPNKVYFTLKVDLRRAMTVTQYDVYAGIDGGEKRLIKKLMVVPGDMYSYDIYIPGVKNGKSQIELEVKGDYDEVTLNYLAREATYNMHKHMDDLDWCEDEFEVIEE